MILIISLRGLENSDLKSFKILVGTLLGSTTLFAFKLPIKTSIPSGVVGVKLEI